MCAAHTFGDEGFPIGHEGGESRCRLKQAVTRFLQFFPSSARIPTAEIPSDGRTTLRIERLMQILVEKWLLTQEEVRRISS